MQKFQTLANIRVDTVPALRFKLRTKIVVVLALTGLSGQKDIISLKYNFYEISKVPKTASKLCYNTTH